MVCFPHSFQLALWSNVRHAQQDEVGTPFGITIDFDTLDDDTVTIRNRDTLKQERIHEKEISSYLEDAIE